jgi:hypothetical protein
MAKYGAGKALRAVVIPRIAKKRAADSRKGVFEMKRKLTTCLLCLLLALALLPVNAALAAGPVCEIVGGAQYDTLDDAVAAVPADTPTTIRLLQTIGRNSTLTLDGAKKLTLNLNGYNLNINAASGAAINISQGSSLTTTGSGALNATGLVGGIYATQSSTINITGNVSATNGGEGVYAYGSGVSVTVTGNVGGNIIGVESLNTASVTVTGTVTGGYYGVWAESGSNIRITGDVTANNHTGVYAIQNARVTVTGDVQATGQNSEGIYAYSGAQVTVSGNVQGVYSGIQASSCEVSVSGSVTTSSANSSYTVYAGSGTEMDIGGNVTGIGDCGVIAETSGKVTVAGDIQSVYTGIRVATGGEVFALGDVTADGTIGVGVNAYSAGEATIDGTIEAHEDMTFGESNGAPVTPTTKQGYLTFSDGGATPSYIWVKGLLPTVTTNAVSSVTQTIYLGDRHHAWHRDGDRKRLRIWDGGKSRDRRDRRYQAGIFFRREYEQYLRANGHRINPERHISCARLCYHRRCYGLRRG